MRSRWPTFWRSGPCALLLLLGALLLAAPAQAQSGQPQQAGKHSVHVLFKGTQYPLTVHVIEGPEPGPTVMVQGGIQGDETAGFLTAQRLTRAMVRRGRLIVVPHANLPSIHSRARLVNVDLNRRFDRDYDQYFEDHLARGIRFFLTQADAFLHLHEGSGFYRPQWIDTLRNPRRFGQSIIIDTAVYDDRVFLAEHVEAVLDPLNAPIANADYCFRLFSTNTFATTTPHAEQRKSLTFHALTSHGIPALAIEVSKDIVQLDWKVEQQLRAVMLFLERFGVEAELATAPATSAFPALTINGQAVSPGKRLTLDTREALEVRLGVNDASSAVGVFAPDRPRTNLLESPRLADPALDKLVVRVDGRRAAVVPVTWRGPGAEAQETRPLFACWLNGELKLVPAGKTLRAVEGDRLMLDTVWGGSREVLNLKGYVSDARRNDGQDAGAEVVLQPELFLKRYLLPGDGDAWRCRVTRETPGRKRVEMQVEVRPRRVAALKLRGPQDREWTVAWKDGQRLALPPGRYTLLDAWSNGAIDQLAFTAGNTPVEWGQPFKVPGDRALTLTVRQAATFRPLGSMTVKASLTADLGFSAAF